MAEYLSRLFFIFFVYSVGGWCVETVRVSLKEKMFVNRGFLIGPYCPIYGSGAALLDVTLNYYTNHPFLYFFLSMTFCGILEYVTSYVLEKRFKARWWDYSTRALNINGRVCAENLLQFGFFGTIFMCYVNKTILSKYYMMNESIRHIIMLVLFLIVISDFIVSEILIKKIKSDINGLAKDNTVEISKKVQELIKERNIFHRRMFKAYPGLKLNILHMDASIKDMIVSFLDHVKSELDIGDVKNHSEDEKEKAEEKNN